MLPDQQTPHMTPSLCAEGVLSLVCCLLSALRPTTGCGDGVGHERLTQLAVDVRGWVSQEQTLRFSLGCNIFIRD